MTHIGYIGLGIMGRAMASNLLKNKFKLTVWNRTPQRADALVDLGADRTNSSAEMAQRDTIEAICLNVTDTPDVESVLWGPAGIVEGWRAVRADRNRRLIVIDHSTIDPTATRRWAEQLADEGIDLLDAPVSGGDVGAQAGTLSMMVGGDRSLFDHCQSLFQAVAKTITYCGPSGTGQATKACNQILCAVNLLGVCEAITLAQREGLDLHTMLDVTTGGAGGSWSLSHLGRQIADHDFDPGFMIDLLNKDLGIVASSQSHHHLDLPATVLASDLFQQAATKLGLGRQGTQAIKQLFEQRNPLPAGSSND